MTHFSRRTFLTGSAAAAGFFAGTGALGALTARSAFGADTAGYKALVCIFLRGGMDHGDTILPVDADEHALLGTIRAGMYDAYGVGSGTSSRDIANLIALNPSNPQVLGGRQVGLPPALQPLAEMFAAGELAVVGNVGPLIAPTDRDGFEGKTVTLPKRLFSHNDQQSTWMSLAVEGERFGWGGRFADAALAASPGANSTFAAINMGSTDVFLSGDVARPLNLPGGSPPQLRALRINRYIGSGSDANAARERLREALSRGDFDSGNLLERDVAAVLGRALPVTEQFGAALSTAPVTMTPFPATGLGRQLQAVANSILIRDQLNVRRQIFFCSIGGFDTHSGQAGRMDVLHGEIATAVKAFRDAMVEFNTWNDVTLFTASDFGRTLTDNGDGTDHGWGAHHFVAGGEVVGGQIYGEIPSADTEGPRYTRSRGRLIPSVSVEQYAATLGNWFGLDGGELATALPNLRNFDTSVGFV